jgi:hypothetical protein
MECGEGEGRTADSGSVRRDGRRFERQADARDPTPVRRTTGEIRVAAAPVRTAPGQRPFRLLGIHVTAQADFLDLRCRSGELEGERASFGGGTMS